MSGILQVKNADADIGWSQGFTYIKDKAEFSALGSRHARKIPILDLSGKAYTG